MDAAQALRAAGVDPYPRPSRWQQLTGRSPLQTWWAGGLTFDTAGNFHARWTADRFAQSCHDCEETLIRNGEVSLDMHRMLSVDRGVPEVYIPPNEPYPGTPPSPLRPYLVTAVGERIDEWRRRWESAPSGGGL